MLYVLDQNFAARQVESRIFPKGLNRRDRAKIDIELIAFSRRIPFQVFVF